MIRYDLTFDAYVDRLASQNDAFRRTVCLDAPGDPALKGHLLVSDTVQAMGPAFMRSCLEAVGRFDSFPRDADPEGYRNCGSVEVEDRTVWFRIVLSDADDPGTDRNGNPVDTYRILHILFSTDWLDW